MRVAFVGKGGAGKSAIAGVLARLLARGGEDVLAVDSDPMPGLSVSLGLGVVDAAIPADAVTEQADGEPGPRFRLRQGLTATAALDRYALPAPDGVRFLQFGKARASGAPLMRSQWAFRQILDGLPSESPTIIGDLPGGTRQPFFGWAGYADTVIVVVPPTSAGLLSARRLAKLATTDAAPRRLVAVVSQARDDGDAERVRQRTGLDVLGSVPWDDQVLTAERDGHSVLDVAPDSPVVAAVTELGDRLAAHTHTAQAALADSRGGP
ncbi:nucleotide-binding protein [Haloechinothrix halophila]|uniref:nucleotide-binding protein n=1 Tax=Haloechinothrix halophila TaxID=1069073 RepID=UPI0009FC3B72|nr:hypothetical protein [Haloechinothrix halophila]